MKSVQRHSSMASALVLLSGIALAQPIHAAAPIVDDAIQSPYQLDGGGVENDPAIYILGVQDGYIRDLEGATVYVGFSNYYNQLTVQNGAKITGANLQSTYYYSTQGNNSVILTGTGTSWTGSWLTYGAGSQNSLIISDGASLSNTGGVFGGGFYVGDGTSGSYNTAVVSDAGSSWTTSSYLYVGQYGSHNSLTVENGASASNGSVTVGSGQTNNLLANSNTVTIRDTGTTWTTTKLEVGLNGGGNRVVIEDQARATNSGDLLVGKGQDWTPEEGDDLGYGNALVVSGTGTVFANGGSLTIGEYGSNNHVEVTDGALFKLTSSSATVSISLYDRAENNTIRLDNGFFAWNGDRVDAISALISSGNFEYWDGSTWVLSTNPNAFSIFYFDNAGDAQAFSGYGDLGGYTIVAVPEPGTWALFGVAAVGMLPAFRRLRKRSA